MFVLPTDICEITALIMAGTFGLACLLSGIFTFHLFYGECSFYDTMENFRKKYKPNKCIWIAACTIILISFSINLMNSPSSSIYDNDDRGYWGSDGYYNPSKSEMDQYIRDAKEWINNN